MAARRVVVCLVRIGVLDSQISAKGRRELREKAWISQHFKDFSEGIDESDVCDA